MSDADRAAIDDDGIARAAGLEVRLLDLDPTMQRRYYDDISNSTLWFIHHGLFDLVRAPSYDAAWWQAWEAYRDVNVEFAEAIVRHAPTGATVLVQDYHLTLVARRARTERDDLKFVHFHHTPFAGPDGFGVLPPAIRTEMLEGLASHDACGFHTPSWESNYKACQRAFSTPQGSTFTSTLNSDVDDLRSVASSAPCADALSGLGATIGDRRVIARVDRMELSKNIVRGFNAFDRLLELRPDLRGDVVFLATCYPSRLGVADYVRYREEVEQAVESINDRWASADWTPVVLMTDDDFPRSVALLRRYDVLVVNPIRDGLNLVAKEGPVVNERNGAVLLSTEAGAFFELEEAVDPVFPFDIEGTCVALGAALDRVSGAQEATGHAAPRHRDRQNSCRLAGRPTAILLSIGAPQRPTADGTGARGAQPVVVVVVAPSMTAWESGPMASTTAVSAGWLLATTEVGSG